MNAFSVVSRGTRRLRRFAAALVATAGLGFAGSAPALVLDVFLDTTPFFDVDARLFFDVSDGDAVENNTATISDFATDGVLGLQFNFGSVMGTLSGTAVVGDAVTQPDLNSLEQDIVLGTFVSFRLTLTEALSDGIPFSDLFAFSLFQAFPGSDPLYETTDPDDALFLVDLLGPGNVPITVFEPLPGSGQPSATLTLTPVSEPGSLLLLTLGALGAGRRRIKICV